MSVIPDPATTDWVPLAGGGGGGLPADTVVVAATRIIANKLLVGDAQPAFRLMGNGTLEWGPGGSGALDNSLSRNGIYGLWASGNLGLGGALTVNGEVYQGNARWFIDTAGAHQWGPGDWSRDTSLYRSGVGTLRLDGMGLRLFKTGQANEQAYLLADAAGAGLPALIFGPGGGTALDIWLYRSGANAMAMNGAFAVATALSSGGGFTAGGQILSNQNGAGATAFVAASLASDGYYAAVRRGADTQWRFLLDNSGAMMWGPGGAVGTDTSLYRSASATLRTPGTLYIDTNLIVGNTFWVATNLVVDNASAGNKLYLGGSLDTNLYREAANLLATDDSFHIMSPQTLVMNNGSSVAGPFVPQIELAYYGSTRQYRSWIGSVHDAGADAGNAIDFTVWKVADGANTLATSRVLRLDGSGKLVIGNAADAQLWRLGVNNLATNSLLSYRLAVGTDWAMATRGGADTSDRWAMTADGHMRWGPGNAGHDTFLRRYNTSQLMTENDLIVGGTLYASFGTSSKIFFGTAVDTNLYRSAANALKTDDDFFVGGGIRIDNILGTYYALSVGGTGIVQADYPSISGGRLLLDAEGQLRLPRQGSAAGVVLGGDANLYRSAANVLKTDGILNAVGGLQINGVPVGGAYTLPERLSTAADGSVTNWNNALSSGWYYAYNAANGIGGGWQLTRVYQHNTSWVTQEAWDFTFSDNPPIYRRVMSSGTWGPWRLQSTKVQSGATGQVYGQGTDNYVYFPFAYTSTPNVVAVMETTDVGQSGGVVNVWGIGVSGFHVSHGQGGTRNIQWMSMGT